MNTNTSYLWFLFEVPKIELWYFMIKIKKKKLKNLNWMFWLYVH